MPSDSTTSLVVPVEWAQRKQHIYINFRVEDLDPKSTSVDISEEKVSFKGKTSTGKELSSTLELFGLIKPEESKYSVRGRGVEVVLFKKEASPYWKRLLKEDKKFHWLRVDFDKWQDEDDSDDEASGGGGGGGGGGFGNMNFEEMMRQMGGLGGGGLGGGADLDGFGDDDEEDDGEGGIGGQDSDDDKLPELEETTSKPSNNTT